MPVYATKLTTAIIESRLKTQYAPWRRSARLLSTDSLLTLDASESNSSGLITVLLMPRHLQYIPAGVIVHTGDFKVDYTPVFGDPIDLQEVW